MAPVVAEFLDSQSSIEDTIYKTDEQISEQERQQQGILCCFFYKHICLDMLETARRPLVLACIYLGWRHGGLNPGLSHRERVY